MALLRRLLAKLWVAAGACGPSRSNTEADEQSLEEHLTAAQRTAHRRERSAPV